MEKIYYYTAVLENTEFKIMVEEFPILETITSNTEENFIKYNDGLICSYINTNNLDILEQNSEQNNFYMFSTSSNLQKFKELLCNRCEEIISNLEKQMSNWSAAKCSLFKTEETKFFMDYKLGDIIKGFETIEFQKDKIRVSQRCVDYDFVFKVSLSYDTVLTYKVESKKTVDGSVADLTLSQLKELGVERIYSPSEYDNYVDISYAKCRFDSESCYLDKKLKRICECDNLED